MAQADLSVRRGCTADVALYWRGLRLFWDPRGRSTRTELVMLYLVPIVLSVPLFFLLAAIVDSGSLAKFVLILLTLLPIPAAVARRFHDCGRSGWLAVPALLLGIIGGWDAWLDVVVAYPENDLWHNRPAQHFIYGLVCLAYAVALMMPPDRGINRYGPNPRPMPNVI
ncbi:MAG: DUF805 domain-containing protein [Alteraurantiacibacter sp.]